MEEMKRAGTNKDEDENGEGEEQQAAKLAAAFAAEGFGFRSARHQQFERNGKGKLRQKQIPPLCCGMTTKFAAG